MSRIAVALAVVMLATLLPVTAMAAAVDVQTTVTGSNVKVDVEVTGLDDSVDHKAVLTFTAGSGASYDTGLFDIADTGAHTFVFNISSLADKTYEFDVKVFNNVDAQQGTTVSDTFTITTPATNPKKPTVKLTTKSGGTINVSITPDSTSDSFEYQIEYQKRGASTWDSYTNNNVDASNSVDYILNGLDRSVTYDVRVTPADPDSGSLYSSYSRTVSIKPDGGNSGQYDPYDPDDPYGRAYSVYNQSGTYTGSGSMTFDINAPRANFNYMTVDGYSVSSGNYSTEYLSGDRTRVTLKSGFLNTLSNGVHSAMFYYYNNRSAGTTFRVDRYGISATPTPPAVTPSATNYVTTASSLRVRSSASTSSAQIGSLPRGSYVTIDTVSNGWGRVALPYGGYGWISMVYVTPTSYSGGSSSGATLTPAAPSQPSIGTSYTTSNLNVRIGAGTGYSSLGVIPAGTSVTIHSYNGVWAYVTVAGITGYMHSSYLR
jgi:uncharacterized protein YgiM (DUF1202 family)